MPSPLRARVVRRLGFALLAPLLLGAGVPVAVGQRAQSRDPARLRAGIFLYASPSIGDPRFARTVILLLDHGSGGSAGVVINQPTEIPVRKVLPDMAEARRLEVPVYWGGPVQPEAVIVLLRNPRRTLGTTTVLPEVLRTTDLETLRSALDDQRPDRQVRVYSGYAGWSPTQLADEVRAGAWVLDRAEADAVFAVDPEPLWEKVHAILRRLEVRAEPPETKPGRDAVVVGDADERVARRSPMSLQGHVVRRAR